MTSATAIVLLGFGLGALVAANGSAPRESLSLRGRADDLRQRAIVAQQNSARAAQIAREATATWRAAEDAARRESQGR